MEALWEKLLFWKKNKTPKLGVDYEFFNFPETDLTGVRILKGDYRGVTYRYGRVAVEEKGELAELQFEYDVVNFGNHTLEGLKSDEKFVTLIGDILRELLINGQTRTIDSEESYL